MFVCGSQPFAMLLHTYRILWFVAPSEQLKPNKFTAGLNPRYHHHIDRSITIFGTDDYSVMLDEMTAPGFVIRLGCSSNHDHHKDSHRLVHVE